MSCQPITPIEGSNVLADLAARINAEHTEVVRSLKRGMMSALLGNWQNCSAQSLLTAGGIKALEATPGAARLLTFFDRGSPSP